MGKIKEIGTSLLKVLKREDVKRYTSKLMIICLVYTIIVAVEVAFGFSITKPPMFRIFLEAALFSGRILGWI